MFLVMQPTDSGEANYILFHADPRPQGRSLPVREGVDLEELPIDDDEWGLDDVEPGEGGPQVVAQSRQSPNRFRFFRSELEVPKKFDVVTGAVKEWATQQT